MALQPLPVKPARGADWMSLGDALYNNVAEISTDWPAVKADINALQARPAAPAKPQLGMWAPGFPAASAVTDHETTTGCRYSIVRGFRGADGGDWLHDDQVISAGTGPTGLGKRVLLAWDMGATAAWNFSSWANGTHDTYLAELADAAKQASRASTTVWVAPWSEMNLDGNHAQPGTGAAAGTAAEFIAAWRHVVDYFRSAGVANIRWVFNPTTDTYAQTTDVATIWPGSGYVDVLGLDGYNWGTTTSPALTWRSFEDVYATQYDRLCTLHPTAPVWVCEVGCKEPSSDDGAPAAPARSKAEWVHDMYTALPRRFPRIEAIVWFSEQKERDWRVDSTPSALGALRARN